MPCYQSTNLPSGAVSAGLATHATLEDCLQACKEGACCEGTTCSITPQCQCQGTGKTFKGAGTVCTPNPCDPCCQGAFQPSSLLLQITAVDRVSPESVSLSFPLIGSYVLPASPSNQATAADCFVYRDLFFANPSLCSTQANSCFAGCTHKLQIVILSSGQLIIGVCDSQATYTPSGIGNAGGEVWGFISNWQAKVCARTSASGTTTNRNNPNLGGVLNAVSYSISFQ